MLSIIGIGLSHSKKKTPWSCSINYGKRYRFEASTSLTFAPFSAAYWRNISFLKLRFFPLLNGTVFFGTSPCPQMGDWFNPVARNKNTGFIPWFNLISLRQRLWFKTFHRVMGTDPGLYTAQVPVAFQLYANKDNLSKSKRLLERRVTLE